ncbi:hypothetical protein BX600DRAFT_247600 [Xylariales sp. PMI_506]|nr:hypothetical protein BX600DRAFT_247600 [Xylariales sp. PMI_506]
MLSSVLRILILLLGCAAHHSRYILTCNMDVSPHIDESHHTTPASATGSSDIRTSFTKHLHRAFWRGWWTFSRNLHDEGVLA